NRRCRRADAVGMGAELSSGRRAGQCQPTFTGVVCGSRTLSWRDGCGAGRLRASGRPSRAEMGFFAGELDSRPRGENRRFPAAYAVLGKAEPLPVAKQIVAGFHRAYSLNETEIAALFPLIGMRLAVSVVNSAIRKTQKPHDEYVVLSESAAWEALERLAKVHP